MISPALSGPGARVPHPCMKGSFLRGRSSEVHGPPELPLSSGSFVHLRSCVCILGKDESGLGCSEYLNGEIGSLKTYKSCPGNGRSKLEGRQAQVRLVIFFCLFRQLPLAEDLAGNLGAAGRRHSEAGLSRLPARSGVGVKEQSCPGPFPSRLLPAQGPGEWPRVCPLHPGLRLLCTPCAVRPQAPAAS